MSRIHTDGARSTRRSPAQESVNLLQKQIDRVTEDTEEIKEAASALQIELRTSIADVRAASESQFSQIENRLETQIDTVLTTLAKMEAKQEDLSVTIIKQMGAQEERERVRKLALDETHLKADNARYEHDRAGTTLTKVRVGLLVLTTIIGTLAGLSARSSLLDRFLPTLPLGKVISASPQPPVNNSTDSSFRKELSSNGR